MHHAKHITIFTLQIHTHSHHPGVMLLFLATKDITTSKMAADHIIQSNDHVHKKDIQELSKYVINYQTLLRVEVKDPHAQLGLFQSHTGQ